MRRAWGAAPALWGKTKTQSSPFLRIIGSLHYNPGAYSTIDPPRLKLTHFVQHMTPKRADYSESEADSRTGLWSRASQF